MAAILEMHRVAKEVRIFPLVDLDARRSRYVDIIYREMEKTGQHAEITEVPYEFQKGGNEMLRITTP